MKVGLIFLAWIFLQSAAFIGGNLWLRGECWLDDDNVLRVVKEKRKAR